MWKEKSTIYENRLAYDERGIERSMVGRVIAGVQPEAENFPVEFSFVRNIGKCLCDEHRNYLDPEFFPYEDCKDELTNVFLQTNNTIIWDRKKCFDELWRISDSEADLFYHLFFNVLAENVILFNTSSERTFSGQIITGEKLFII